jgi:hypothetical protein
LNWLLDSNGAHDVDLDFDNSSKEEDEEALVLVLVLVYTQEGPVVPLLLPLPVPLLFSAAAALLFLLIFSATASFLVLLSSVDNNANASEYGDLCGTTVGACFGAVGGVVTLADLGVLSAGTLRVTTKASSLLVTGICGTVMSFVTGCGPDCFGGAVTVADLDIVNVDGFSAVLGLVVAFAFVVAVAVAMLCSLGMVIFTPFVIVLLSPGTGPVPVDDVFDVGCAGSCRLRR